MGFSSLRNIVFEVFSKCSEWLFFVHSISTHENDRTDNFYMELC